MPKVITLSGFYCTCIPTTLADDISNVQSTNFVFRSESPSHALFIYTAQTLPVAQVKDLTLESVVPIDQDFK